MRLVQAIKKHLLNYKHPRLRDKRGAWNASDLAKPARDLYWKAIGEPETQSLDLTRACTMAVGKWIEDGITREILNNLHWLGLHAYGGEQISVGGSNPDVNGYIDGMLVERDGDKMKRPVVLEIKTKRGFGAERFKQSCDPGASYMLQLGYYLKDLSEKGLTNEGMFLFVLLNDKCYGEMIQIRCTYENGIVTAHEAEHSDGTVKKLGISADVDAALERLKEIEECVANKELPQADYHYKKPLTPALLAEQSDDALRKALKNKKVIGDWQIAYSPYKQKHVELEGGYEEYTEAELELIKAEYRRRYPRSKLAS